MKCRLCARVCVLVTSSGDRWDRLMGGYKHNVLLCGMFGLDLMFDFHKIDCARDRGHRCVHC